MSAPQKPRAKRRAKGLPPNRPNERLSEAKGNKIEMCNVEDEGNLKPEDDLQRQRLQDFHRELRSRKSGRMHYKRVVEWMRQKASREGKDYHKGMEKIKNASERDFLRRWSVS